MGFGDRHHQVDLVGLERERPLDPLEVRRQKPIGNVRAAGRSSPSPHRRRPVAEPPWDGRRRIPGYSSNRPSTRPLTISIFFSVGMNCFSFWKPSRGPTSTMVTFSGGSWEYPFLVIFVSRRVSARGESTLGFSWIQLRYHSGPITPSFLSAAIRLPLDSQREKQLLAALPGGGRIVAKPEVVVVHPQGNPRKFRLSSIRKGRFQQSPRLRSDGGRRRDPRDGRSGAKGMHASSAFFMISARVNFARRRRSSGMNHSRSSTRLLLVASRLSAWRSS